MIAIDGSLGEGGGQVLRSALALSLVTGQPFRMVRIRAGRAKPGLQRQHLVAVQAATEVGQAAVTGAEIGSLQITFSPGQVRYGEFVFQIGSAGSTTLVLQTVLPALLRAPEPSGITLAGGTHNPFAPPFDFVEKVFLPVVNRMGPSVAATLERPGFYPAGGGEIRVSIQPAGRLAPLELRERGAVRKVQAVAWLSRLPRHIAERELNTIRAALVLEPDDLEIREVPDSPGPGNVVQIEVQCDHIGELFTAFGQRGVPAEKVAETVVAAAQRYIEADVPVDEHLADQLLLPFALAGGGSFRTTELSSHARTNMNVIRQFLDCRIDAEVTADGATLVCLAAG